MSWAEVKHALNSTLGTDEFVSLDKMIAGGTQTFMENGTFVVPNGVYKILITACAGGESGTHTGQSNYDGSGGQGGEYIYKKAFSVSPKSSINITIGKGGSPNINKRNVPGGNTVIGGLITLLGGGIEGCAGCISSRYVSGTYFSGQSSQTAPGGNAYKGNDESSIYYGGGASLGRGAEADSTSNIIAGYGGGGGGSRSGNIQNDGGNGIVIIEW